MSNSGISAAEISDFNSLLAEWIEQLPTKHADFQSLLNQIVELARILTGATGAAIAFRGEHGTVCGARAGEGAPPIGAPVDVTSGISKQCLDTGTPLCCEDIATDARADADASHAIGMRAMAVVPIYSAGEVAGILAVFSGSPGAFTNQHLQKLQRLAKLIDSGTRRDTRASNSAAGISLKRKPDLRLLVEPEPAYRGFLLNLVDMVSLPWRSPSSASSGAHGWDHVFVDSRISWKPLLESLVLHVVVVGMFLGLSRVWPRERLVFSQPLRDAHITYYPPSQSYPARQSSRPATLRHALARRSLTSADGAESTRAGIRVKREGPKKEAGSVAPPDLPITTGNGLQRLSLGAASAALPSPPPSLRARRPDLPAGSVVAPSPELSGPAGLRRPNTPVGTVVPPSPEVTGGMARMAAGNPRRLGSIVTGTGTSAIVPPPPTVNEHPALTYGAAGTISSSAMQVIAPPPSVQGRGGLGTRGDGAGLGGSRSQVVGPPPPLQGREGAGQGAGGDARIGSLVGGGQQVVPPAPSVGQGGSFGGRGTSVALGGGGSEVVPPPPSVHGGAGGFSAGGRGGGLGTGGAQIGPPGPLLGGGGNSVAGGRGGLSAGGGSGTVLPSSGASGAGPAGGGAPAAPDVPPSSLPRVGSTPARASFQDAQLQVVSLAMSLPTSSYFSNYEVFVAEKWLSKTESQLIKLVYVFLPYQRRLSEYGDLSKVFKVRVTRDPTCDESLMQIMWPEGENAKAPSRAAAQGLASAPSERKNLLPCYRTTADDYRRALSRKR